MSTSQPDRRLCRDLQIIGYRWEPSIALKTDNAFFASTETVQSDYRRVIHEFPNRLCRYWEKIRNLRAPLHSNFNSLLGNGPRDEKRMFHHQMYQISHRI